MLKKHLAKTDYNLKNKKKGYPQNRQYQARRNKKPTPRKRINTILLTWDIKWLTLLIINCLSHLFGNRCHHLMAYCRTEFQRLMYKFPVSVYLAFCPNILLMSCCPSQARFEYMTSLLASISIFRDLFIFHCMGILSSKLICIANAGGGLGCYFTC